RVGPAGALARAKGVPVIAFSTDANVAARGVYLLSFLPESDVNRIVSYAVAQQKRSLAALVPDNAYGNVVQASFQQAVSRRGARVIALERYGQDPPPLQEAVKRGWQASSQARPVLLSDGPDALQIRPGLGTA